MSSSSRPAVVAAEGSSAPSSPSPSQTQRHRVVPPKGWLHFVAGGAAGMCGAIVTSPLDVVKTRLQSDLFNPSSSKPAASRTAPSTAPAPPRGVLASARRLGYHFVETGILLKEISVKEGPRALFKGLGPTLVGAVPARAINFYTYGNGKLFLSEQFNSGQETVLIHLASAAMAGLATATATNPIWVVKTRLQLEGHAFQAEERRRRAQAIGRASGGQPPSRSAATATPSPAQRGLRTSALLAQESAASSSAAGASLSRPDFFRSGPSPPRPSTNSLRMTLTIVRQEGVKGLYRGLSASYLGVAEGTIQWVLYERLKKLGGANQQQDSVGGTSRTQKWLNMVGAAGTAKCIASLITYPHEVIRTRLRQQPPPGQALRYTGLVQTFKLVLREEGAAALYGGLSAHLLRVVPNAAIMFSVYELALRLGSRVEILPPASTDKTASVVASAETSTEA